jgi:HK97 family phage major capsid protein
MTVATPTRRSTVAARPTRTAPAVSRDPYGGHPMDFSPTNGRNPGLDFSTREALRSFVQTEIAMARADGRPVGFSPAIRGALVAHGIPFPENVTPEPIDRVARAWRRYINGGYGFGEHRDLGTASGAAGGYLIPAQYLPEVLFGVRASSGLLSRVHTWTPTSGAPATYPMLLSEPLTNAATVAENTQRLDSADLAFTRVVFPQVQEWGMPGLLRASRGLVQDSEASGVDFTNLVHEAVAWRLSRAMDAYAVASLTAGATQTVVSGAPLVYTNLVSLISSVDPALQSGNDCALVVSPNGLKAIRNLTDGARPIVLDQPFVAQVNSASAFGGTETRTYFVPTILGVPVVTSRALADPANTGSATCAIFGAFSRAWVMRFVDCTVQTLNETFADYGDIGWTGFARADGAVADPSAFAILNNHA